jgi:hypothetical protein
MPTVYTSAKDISAMVVADPKNIPVKSAALIMIGGSSGANSG